MRFLNPANSLTRDKRSHCIAFHWSAIRFWSMAYSSSNIPSPPPPPLPPPPLSRPPPPPPSPRSLSRKKWWGCKSKTRSFLLYLPDDFGNRRQPRRGEGNDLKGPISGKTNRSDEGSKLPDRKWSFRFWCRCNISSLYTLIEIDRRRDDSHLVALWTIWHFRFHTIWLI